jgi:eukaryotic-like serine/threonine-protein kinase
MLRTPELVGRALDDRYELTATIGEGTFGRVYRGLDRRLDRAVAVKVIKPWWAEDSTWVESFQREARLLARISDPGIVQIFDFGHAREGPYYVAELVEGESLADRLREGPLEPERASHIAEQLCAALGSAHRQGIVHCDIKPANVMLTPDGNVKVGDFGVARLAEATSRAHGGTVVGTPRYMSPEQARGRPTTAATDVYSAGVVLYEMLAGRPPFEAASAVELGIRHLQDPPPPLAAGIPAPLREVVERALEKDPARRYADGSAMADALRGARSLPEAGAPPEQAAPGRAAPAAVPRRAPRPGPPRDPGQSGAEESAATVDLTAARAAAEAPTHVLGRPGDPPAGRSDHRAGRGRRRGLLIAAALAAVAVAVVVVLGSRAKTTVPELRGLPSGGVRARTARAHLHPVFSRRYSEAARTGVALAQRPAPGARVTSGSAVQVVLSAGPPPVSVPAVTGRASSAAESVLEGAGLHYALTPVSSPGSTAGKVLRQAPAAGASAPRGSTVRLSVVEAPRWRPVTSFAGVDDGHSVPFRIRGTEWRLSYAMSYTGTCLLLITCFGPSAEAEDLGSESSGGEFDLGEGSSEVHTFHSGPGLFLVRVSGGRDSASWHMTVEDRY